MTQTHPTTLHLQLSNDRHYCDNEMSVPRRRRGSSKSEDTEKLLPTVTSTSSTAGTSFRSGEDKENMGRDRTSEFQSALRSLQGRQQRQLQPNPMALANHRVNRNLEQYSEFMRVAK